MSDRQGLIWDAAERGNIRLRKCEMKEYLMVKMFIRDNPGCTMETIRKNLGTWRVHTLVAYGVSVGDIRGDLGRPERWWLA